MSIRYADAETVVGQWLARVKEELGELSSAAHIHVEGHLDFVALFADFNYMETPSVELRLELGYKAGQPDPDDLPEDLELVVDVWDDETMADIEPKGDDIDVDGRVPLNPTDPDEAVATFIRFFRLMHGLLPEDGSGWERFLGRVHEVLMQQAGE